MLSGMGRRLESVIESASQPAGNVPGPLHFRHLQTGGLFPPVWMRVRPDMSGSETLDRRRLEFSGLCFSLNNRQKLHVLVASVKRIRGMRDGEIRLESSGIDHHTFRDSSNEMEGLE